MLHMHICLYDGGQVTQQDPSGLKDEAAARETHLEEEEGRNGADLIFL